MRRAGGYVRGTAVIAAVDAVLSFVVLTLIGVSLAGPLAVLVLAAGFIPYIGGLFVAAILLLAGLALGGVPTALLFLLLVIILKFVEQRRLPRFLSDRTLELHPAVILLALLVGFTMGGLAGMFVAVPTIAVVIGHHGRRARCARDQGHRQGLGEGRHPRLARPSGAMELATARRGRPDRARGRHPVAVPGRGRPDRRRGHPGRDVPAGGRGARAPGLDPGPCFVRGQRRRLGDRDGRDVAVGHGPWRFRPGGRPGRDHRRERRRRIPPRRCVRRGRAAVPAGRLRDPRAHRLGREQPRLGARVPRHHGAARVLHAARRRPGMGVDHLASRWLAPDAGHARGRSGGDDARRLHDRDRRPRRCSTP